MISLATGTPQQPLHGARVELERALILQLLQDVLLDLLERPLGVDEVVVEDFLERLERVPGLLLERLVAPPRQRLVVVGGPILAQLADAGAPHFLVVGAAFRGRVSAGARSIPSLRRTAP